MAESVQLCSNCGHISPSEWEACHNCSGEFDDEASYSLDELNRYYRAIEEGYGRYMLIGYLLYVGAPIASFILAALLVALFGSSELVAGAVLIVIGLSQVVGPSLFLGSYGHISGDVSGGRGLAGTVLYGFGMAVVLGIVLTILLAIPLVNAIVGLIGMILFLGSPYFAYQFYKRIQVDQATAVAALLVHAETLDESLPDALDTWAGRVDTSPARYEMGTVPSTVFENVADSRSREAVETAFAVLSSAPPSRSPSSYAELLSGRDEPVASGGSEAQGAAPTAIAGAPARDPETGAFTEADAE